MLPYSGDQCCGYKDINHPFLTKDVINRLVPIVFHDLIKKHNLDYDISKEGYNWKVFTSMCKAKGMEDEIWQRSIPYYIMKNYDLTWKSFKELFDITI